jgi:flagellar biosynthesis/type III secretory pathway protein FliH
LQAEIEASVRTEEHRQEVSAMGRTIAEELVAKGRKEGLKEGRKKAEVKVRQQTLLHLLSRRFGDLPREIKAAVTAARSIEQLDAWLERLLDAQTVADVGIGERG